MEVEQHIIAEARSLAQTETLDQPVELASAEIFLAKVDDASVLAAHHFVGTCGKHFKIGPKQD